MLKIKFSNSDIRSATTLQTSTISDEGFNRLLIKFNEIFDRTNLYESLSEKEDLFDSDGNPKGNIFFSFKPIAGDDVKERYSPDIINATNPKSLSSNLSETIFNFRKYRLPSTMDLNK